MPADRIVIQREPSRPDRTMGVMSVYIGELKVAEFQTLELPWRDNKKRVSCIPAGVYKAKPRSSPRYGDHLWVRFVPNRDMILVHAGNFPKNTEGCILIGMERADLDRDGEPDLTRSRDALRLLLEFLHPRNSLRFEVLDA